MCKGMSGSGTSPSDGIETLWLHAVDNWDAEQAHAALLELAKNPEQLSALAGRYRVMKADPARSEIADRQLGRIAALAMAQLSVRHRPPDTRNQRWKLYLWSALFAIGTAWMLLQI